MGRRSVVGQVLVASLLDARHPARSSLAALVADTDLTGLHQRARAHRIVSPVYRAVAGIEGAEPDQVRLLAADVDASLRRHLRALVDLENVQATFGARGIPWLVVKGPVIAQELYGDDTLRSYADLDVLVPRTAFRSAVEQCIDDGLPVVRTDWPTAIRELAGELCVICPRGTFLDLHWDLVYHARSRARFSVVADEMFDRAVPVNLAGTRVLTLDPADTLLHLALHSARGGGARLGWLKDIERCVTVGRPDWDAVVSRSRRWGLALVAAVMLDRTAAVLGAEIPHEVLDDLGGEPWRRLVRMTGRLRPVEETAGRRSVASLIVRATGPSGWSSVRFVGAQARTAVRRKPSAGMPAVELERELSEGLVSFLDAVSVDDRSRPVPERGPAGRPR